MPIIGLLRGLNEQLITKYIFSCFSLPLKTGDVVRMSYSNKSKTYLCFYYCPEWLAPFPVYLSPIFKDQLKRKALWRSFLNPIDAFPHFESTVFSLSITAFIMLYHVINFLFFRLE